MSRLYQPRCESDTEQADKRGAPLPALRRVVRRQSPEPPPVLLEELRECSSERDRLVIRSYVDAPDPNIARAAWQADPRDPAVVALGDGGRTVFVKDARKEAERPCER